MSIPQAFLQELIARADVVEIVGRYVQLKKSGANYMGLCPFHGEKSPSFSVSPAKQFYHCFGCGKNGNAISFLMEHTGMSFVEAVKDLAQEYGLSVPEDNANPDDRSRAAEQRKKQLGLSDILEKANDAYRKQLKGAPPAIDYLRGRGLSGEIARQYGLGYAPGGWRHLASVFSQYDDPMLVESGLVIVSEDDDKRYDRFRDRITFPIRNIKGECIGFGGRVLGDEKPKYLNSPETPLFSKGRELYGLFEARQALRELGYVLVTEGYMDVVALAQLGFPNAVATLGTACTAEHLQKLFRFTDSVVFSFDGDAAGRRAARKALDGALPYATDVRSVKFLFLPPEHDPDSFIRQNGAEAFAKCVSDATPLSRFLIEAAREGCDLNTHEGRAHLANNAQSLWMAMPDGALKRQILGDLADLVQLSTRELGELWLPKTNSRARDGYRQRRETSSNRDIDRDEAFAALEGYAPSYQKSFTRRTSGKASPASRADHAARLLLEDQGRWDQLSGEDHAMLCQLPEPHGALFSWLETQLLENGPQSWGALREGLREKSFEAIALRLMSGDAWQHADSDDSSLELRGLLDRLLIEQFKAKETEAIEAVPADPLALERYRALQLRRRALEARLTGNSE